MAEVPRNKGQFTQAGMVMHFPTIGGSVISHDGTVACDEVYLQADFPTLYAVLGDEWTDAGKGDDINTQFRTPKAPNWSSDPEWEARIRF